MSEGGEYSYDPGAAQAAEERVGSAASNLQGAVDELRDHIQRLAGAWQGGEHDDFSGVQGTVMNGFDSITQILSQIQEAVGENTENVSAMQNRIRQTIHQG
ncbi:WXG100 family type VII secretion target [Gordonia sp. NPDC003585]|uniref:WXG100 family type VII secretion target n=2 Tax=Gordonia TaxID=2053 RepID=UPI0033B6F624